MFDGTELADVASTVNLLLTAGVGITIALITYKLGKRAGNRV